MVSELSTGFQEDCQMFLEKFTKRNSYEFSQFCRVWNELGFHNIFYERQSLDELTNFIEEAFTIVKRMLIRSTGKDKVCCLFLLYAIYVKQPEKDAAKIRVCKSDWDALIEFYNQFICENYKDAFVVFWQLLFLNAYYFCLSDSKHIMEADKERDHLPTDIDPELSFKPISTTLKAELDSIQSNLGILNAIEAVEIAYNEMKEHLGPSNQCADTGLPSTTVVTDIRDALNDIEEILHRNENVKKKRKTRKQSLKSYEEIASEEDEVGQQPIETKRKAIKTKASKVVKKKKAEVAGSSSMKTQQSSTHATRKNIVDQKHFKKITLVQEIFEHNFTLGNIELELGLKEEPAPLKEEIASASMPEHDIEIEDPKIIKSEEDEDDNEIRNEIDKDLVF